jgi:hypothetical protein
MAGEKSKDGGLGSMLAQFDSLSSIARDASGMELAGFSDDLSSMAETILSLGKEQWASGVYSAGSYSKEGSLYDHLTSTLSSLKGRLENEAGILSAADQSVNLLTSIDSVLSSVNSGLQTAEDLIVQSIEQSRVETVQVLQGIYSSLGGTASSLLAYGAIDGSHASGLNYVPFDGYRAELHRGERVLTTSEARQHDQSATDNSADIRALQREIRDLKGVMSRDVADPIVRAVRRTSRDRAMEVRA